MHLINHTWSSSVTIRFGDPCRQRRVTEDDEMKMHAIRTARDTANRFTRYFGFITYVALPPQCTNSDRATLLISSLRSF